MKTGIIWRNLGRYRWFLILALVAVPHLLRAQPAPAPTPEPGQLDVQILGQEAAETPAAPVTAEAGHPAAPAEEHSAAELILEAEHADEHGEHGGGGHSDPVGPILLALAAILILAKLGGAVFMKFHQPAVLGELVFGVLLGNGLLLLKLTPEQAATAPGLIGLYGRMIEATLAHGSPIDILARIGVVLLLFMVGLESNIQAMLKVGLSSLLVAVLGVIAPFILGFVTSYYMLPGDHDIMVHVFIGATLCATSVGITARVLQELKRLDTDESRIVLGAAVLDDVMGLVILAVVAGIIGAKGAGQELAPADVIKILVLAIGFLLVAVIGGQWLSPRVFKLATRLRGDGLLLIIALIICFLLAGAANLIGLAPIVGAFAAGLLLDEVHYQQLQEKHGDHDLAELVEPIAAFLVPIFFIQMGMTVKLETFANLNVLGFAAVLTIVAALGKQVCALGVLGKGLDRLSVGVGMIPRGEVGLIFAAIGQGLRLHGEPVIGPMANSAVVIMVIVTTMMTPPLLQATLKRGDAKKQQRPPEGGAPPVSPGTPGTADHQPGAAAKGQDE